MPRIALALPLVVTLLAAPALAEKAFGPEDAAYIDWSWKNCETASTQKEHDLADQATAKDRSKFHEQYQKALEKLAAQQRPASEVERLCKNIFGMYGPSASVIPDLIYVKGETPPAPTPAAATTPTETPTKHGRKRH